MGFGIKRIELYYIVCRLNRLVNIEQHGRLCSLHSPTAPGQFINKWWIQFTTAVNLIL